MLLDEPTNHLDIPAREALESFLRDWPGTLLVVSHDRRLLETITQKLWVVEAGAAGEVGRAVEFDGGYKSWRQAVGEGWTVAAELDRTAHRFGQAASSGSQSAPSAGAALRSSAATASPASSDRLREAAGQPSLAAGAGGRNGSRASTNGSRATTNGSRARGTTRLSKDAYRRQSRSVEDDLTRLGLRKSQLELALGDSAVQSNYVELRRLTSELADVDAALGAGRGRLARARRACPQVSGSMADEADPFVIGLTGPIGCGKSAVASALADLGGTVIDADAIARETTAPGEPTLGPIRQRFGDAVFAPDGSLDRAALAAVVFSDPSALRDLEAITHPAVRRRVLEQLERARAAGDPFVAIEAIKLVEGGLADRCDEVWLVECSPAEQRQRLVARGMAPEDLERRIAAQGPDLAERLASRATRRVSTAGTLADTRARVEDALADALAPVMLDD